MTARILLAVLAMVGCGDTPNRETTESGNACSVGTFEEIRAVSCDGWYCLVCTGHRCYSYPLDGCK